jgi:hypothetical protein
MQSSTTASARHQHFHHFILSISYRENRYEFFCKAFSYLCIHRFSPFAQFIRGWFPNQKHPPSLPPSAFNQFSFRALSGWRNVQWMKKGSIAKLANDEKWNRFPFYFPHSLLWKFSAHTAPNKVYNKIKPKQKKNTDEKWRNCCVFHCSVCSFSRLENIN